MQTDVVFNKYFGMDYAVFASYTHNYDKKKFHESIYY